MALRHVLHFPDPRLRNKALPVTVFDDQLQTLVDDMLETMYVDGIGLAATQINVPQRVIVIDLSEDRSQPLVLINMEIIAREGSQISREGCLSVPGIYESVTRAKKVTVQALDRQGKSFTMDAEDLLAACMQHELDHLDGKLFIDHLSPLKRHMVEKKLRKQRPQTL